VAWTVLFAAARPLPAQTQPESPAAPAAQTQPSYPSLERLNRESISLHAQMQKNILRVQLPPPRWVGDPARFQKYKLNPEVNRLIQQRAARGNAYDNQRPVQEQQQQQSPEQQAQPENVPGEAAKDETARTQQQRAGTEPSQAQQPAGQGYTILVPAQQGDAQQLLFNNAGMNNRAGFVSNNLGLLLDDRGHLLVPAYLERESAGDQPIKLACSDGEILLAKYVGSDQQTQLTVLQLPAPEPARAKADKEIRPPPLDKAETAPAAEQNADCLGAPVKLSDQALRDGTLVMMLSPTDGAGRLAVWNGAVKETGVVVTIDGKVAGIARQGQLLTASACRLIADQIIRHGAVRRATLGVIITQVEPNDPARQAEALGDRPAVRIDQVMKDSVAEAGGLRKGDLILSLAGKAVHDIPSLAAAIAARQGPTELRILRDGQILTVRVDLVQK